MSARRDIIEATELFDQAEKLIREQIHADDGKAIFELFSRIGDRLGDACVALDKAADEIQKAGDRL